MDALIYPAAPVRVVDTSGVVQTVPEHIDMDVFPLIEWDDAAGTEGSTLHIAS